MNVLKCDIFHNFSPVNLNICYSTNFDFNNTNSPDDTSTSTATHKAQPTRANKSTTKALQPTKPTNQANQPAKPLNTRRKPAKQNSSNHTQNPPTPTTPVNQTSTHSLERNKISSRACFTDAGKVQRHCAHLTTEGCTQA